MNASPRPARRSRRTILALATALLLGPLGGACSGSAEKLHVVDISDEKGFKPATLPIVPGDTVRWKNYGIHPHTVTDDAGAERASLPAGAQPFDSGAILPGRTWAYTFTTPGEYRYISTDDQGRSFVGTISVGG